MLEQVVPAGRREADAEVTGDLAGQAATLEVIHRVLALRMAFQGLAIVLGSGIEQRVERRVHRLARCAPAPAFLARHIHAGALGQFLDRLGKFQLIVVHDEAEGIAAGAAAEAVVELLVRADGERGGLFLVERAAGAVVLAGLLQLDARAHHIDDVGAVEQVIDEGLRDQAGHRRSAYCPAQALDNGWVEKQKLRSLAKARGGVFKCNARPEPGIRAWRVRY